MRILIVEDQEKLAKSLKKGLEQEGYAVDYVLDGEAAERRIEVGHKDYDLIVLDLMLPKKDGYEICRNMRAHGIATPVIVLTARGATEDKISALNIGADDYLVKPFSFKELLARINALLRRPEVFVPSELTVRDLQLNTATREVYRGGKNITLTLKEFSVLEYLIKNKGRVVNREELVDHVWDFNYDGFSNVVDVHIKNLRNKIDFENDEKILETVRGVGYRIKA
ncbi:MAG: DNA-binding response regulator [Candidatus Liptonbacteria bacterium RIFCSPHIGHO2_01_FULL_57_28]|uniref:DNA-binding response regulator n=1 Tax=Candidatus Liptonbacteria bacterium RIFCSPHIGHO2_01_FULL_57_28 TaxID=1798647 RepID=A0A1G2CC94_9BACT|nr:MAG: DNA-binding response regulator [Candidatus Liptonbacteria bacterium RIFCSPHIGHO2_01_FULL_57_28]